MTPSIQEHFAERCDALADVMVQSARQRDAWDIYLGNGSGERAIAGDHEARHLLELLQNARDAIYRGRLEGDHTPGRVFVAVTQRGMAIANSGAPFRLNDDDVLRAVLYLLRSEKSGHGFIGHKGVGLKSILLHAGGFSVRSRIDGEVLRASFSRSRTADCLLTRLSRAPGGISSEQWLYVRQQLPRLPLFTQPHADPPSAECLEEDAALVDALLGEGSLADFGFDLDQALDTQPYTTVVYLPYRDPHWEQQLTSVHHAIAEEVGPEGEAGFIQAKRQVGMLSARANAESAWEELLRLDRRVLALLGEIGEVTFVRFHQARADEIHSVSIAPSLSLEGRAGGLCRLQLTERTFVRDKATEQVSAREFMVLSTETGLGVVEDAHAEDAGPHERIRILIEIPGDEQISLRDEPLYLYYPIESELSGLPFLVHGPFRVNPSRTTLVKGQERHNRAVLKEAVALLRHSLPDLGAESSEIRNWLPWILLPDAGSRHGGVGRNIDELGRRVVWGCCVASPRNALGAG